MRRVRARQAHGGVEIVGSRSERAVEDRHDVAGVDHVEHVGDAVLATQGRDGLSTRRIQLSRDETRIAQPVDHGLGAQRVVVGHHPCLEEVAARRDEGGGRADSA
jgi:hypothetical protein